MRTAKGLLGSMFLAIGCFAGAIGLSAPNLDLTSPGNNRIDVLITPDGASVNLYWRLDSQGNVGFQVETPTLGLGNDAITEAEVYLVLYCEARLASYTATPTLSDSSAHLENVDGTDNCRTDFATSLPHQVLRVSVRQGSGGLVTGSMLGTWTASGGGERLARTPKIALAESAYVHSEGKVFAYEPGELSTLRVTLGRSASETMELASPETFRHGWSDSSGQTANTTSPGNYESNSMIWAAEFANVEPGDGQLEVPSGFARFTEPGERQRAQLALLVAGLALGIGASLFVEFALSAGHRRPRNDGSAPH